MHRIRIWVSALLALNVTTINSNLQDLSAVSTSVQVVMYWQWYVSATQAVLEQGMLCGIDLSCQCTVKHLIVIFCATAVQ